MKKCKNCGLEFNDDYLFCPSCGGDLINGNICRNCGEEIPAGYAFCPECGTKVGDNGYAGDTTVSESYSAPPSKPKKKISLRAKLIIGGCAAAAVIIAIVLVIVASPRNLSLNSGEKIDIYVGDASIVPIYGEGLTEEDYSDVTWTTDDGEVLTVEDGTIKASYDSDLFNELEGEGEEEDMDPCSCTTQVRAELKKGIRKWEGSAKVVISLKPIEFESGELVKKPADSRDSSLEVTPSDDYNTYFYLKSSTKKANDISFIVKKGEKTTVAVPRDHYTVYWANGYSWYGGEFLFGPQTTYLKDNEEWDFDTYSWTLSMEAGAGSNTSSETVSEDDFPEL